MMIICIIIIWIITVVKASNESENLKGIEIHFKNSQDVIYSTYSSSYYNPSSNSNEYLKVISLGTNCKKKAKYRGETNQLIVIDRGECSFEQKILNALDYNSNPNNVIVIDNVYESLFNKSTNKLNNVCDMDCEYSSSTLIDCESNPKCLSGQCASNSKIYNQKEEKFCCILDDVFIPNIGKAVKKIDLPVIFVSMNDGIKLKNHGNQVTVNLRHVNRVDPSVYCIAIIAMIALIFGTYRAAKKERTYAYNTKKQVFNIEEIKNIDQEIEQVDLSMKEIASFLCATSTMLVILFYLVLKKPHLVVILLNVMFGLGSMSALSYIMIQPIIELFLKIKRRAEILSLMISITICTFWFFERHWQYSFIVRNILAMSLTSSFMLAIRLPNLKVACALLITFFFYDIFMVFISPSLFSGKSIMVEVATSGKEDISITKELNCKRVNEETMPMLFSFPRFDWINSSAMLGLGDVVLPGLLVTLALRIDYAKYSKSNIQLNFLQIHQYYIGTLIAYFLGLCLCFTANINGWSFGTGVKGQPALLYLVPFCLSTIIIMSKYKNDFNQIYYNTSYIEQEQLQQEEVIDDEQDVESAALFNQST